MSREFYINDRGAQMDKFGASLQAAAHGRPIPEDGYHGEYIADLARQIVSEEADILDLPEDEQVTAFREEGYERQLEGAAGQLDDFRTSSTFGSPSAACMSGRVAHASRLREKGHVYERTTRSGCGRRTSGTTRTGS